MFKNTKKLKTFTPFPFQKQKIRLHKEHLYFRKNSQFFNATLKINFLAKHSAIFCKSQLQLLLSLCTAVAAPFRDNSGNKAFLLVHDLVVRDY